METTNPFTYDGAISLSYEELAEIYCEDFNYSRVLLTPKNVILLGERGTGKTMTLLYHSLPVQFHKSKVIPKEKVLNFYIHSKGIVANNNDLKYFPENKAEKINEHFLSASIISSIFEALRKIPGLFDNIPQSEFIHRINEKLNLPIQFRGNIAASIIDYMQHAKTSWQMGISKIVLNGDNAFYFDTPLSFQQHVLAIFNELQSIPSLSEAHFSLMIDDAQFLNIQQMQLINSWISSRNYSGFSFKLATVNLDHPSYHTSEGHPINKGHDYTSVNMVMSFQNADSRFAKLAKDVIEKRLSRYLGLHDIDANVFFPLNTQFAKELECAKFKAFELAKEKYPNGPQKSINDYVYKYHRAIYFRERSSKANRPPYSGLDIIVQLSTGVLRNLLEPCWYMFDELVSRRKTNQGTLSSMPPSIQTQVIMEHSREAWKLLHDGLNKLLPKCTEEQSGHVYALLDNLCIFFKNRLMADISEPRAVMFSISEPNFEKYTELIELINIARRAQLIYERQGNAKDDGKSESYFVLNKMLLPNRGLDPIGQHARVSIKAKVLYEAAVNNKRIPNIFMEADTGNATLF